MTLTERKSARNGFTLIEVLLVQGMIAVIAGIVIIAISPRKNFVTVRDTERKHYAKQLNQAMNTYLIEEWKMPSNESIPTCVEDNKITCGKPICKATVDDSDCLNENAVPLSILPPTYISALPVDIVMDNNDNCIGYMVYQNIGRSYVFNPNMGKLEGDDPHEESECGTGLAGVCGNGILEEGEACDDDNENAEDGCDDSCAIEPLYECVGELGEQSVCNPIFAGTCTNPSDPYQITYCTDLQNINLALHCNYILTQDIGCGATNPVDVGNAGSVWDNGGLGFDPLGDDTTQFTGSINGDGYTIANLYIDRPTDNKVGMIGYSAIGTVTNLTLASVDVTGAGSVGALMGYGENTTIDNVHVPSGTVNGDGSVGGLIGYEKTITGPEAFITHSSARVTVEGTSSVGGLAGAALGTRIEDSFATGNVTATQTNSQSPAGGLVGTMSFAHIKRSYASGNVGSYGHYIGGLIGQVSTVFDSVTDSYATGYAHALAVNAYTCGGFIGKNGGAITNCYSTGNASCNSEEGGFIGDGGAVSPTSSYWDTQTSGNATSDKGVGKSSAQMHQQTTFTGWNFGAIWTIVEGVSSPTLQ